MLMHFRTRRLNNLQIEDKYLKIEGNYLILFLLLSVESNFIILFLSMLPLGFLFIACRNSNMSFYFTSLLLYLFYIHMYHLIASMKPILAFTMYSSVHCTVLKLVYPPSWTVKKSIKKYYNVNINNDGTPFKKPWKPVEILIITGTLFCDYIVLHEFIQSNYDLITT